MNSLTIIGNLTADPVLRRTQSGIAVTNFTVAVNRRAREGQEQKADFFRVTVWRQQAESCARYLTKGRKVACRGTVSLSTWESGGKTYVNLEVEADDVEFLTPRDRGDAYEEPEAESAYSDAAPPADPPRQTRMEYPVYEDDEDIPF